METDFLCLEKMGIDKEGYLVVGIIEKREQTHRTGTHTEVFHHALLRGEREFALVELMLDVVDVHLMVGVHDDEVMAVAFMVAEEEVLAKGSTLTPVVLGGLSNGGSLGVLIVFVGDAQLVEILVNYRLSVHNDARINVVMIEYVVPL